MRIFKNKPFSRFAKKEDIDDWVLCEAIDRAERGKIDADLGGGLIKQRIARRGEGKSSGYRTIIIFRSGDKAFFVYGFAKNAKDNLNHIELKVYKDLAKLLGNYSEQELKEAVDDGWFIEVKQDVDSENLQK